MKFKLFPYNKAKNKNKNKNKKGFYLILLQFVVLFSTLMFMPMSMSKFYVTFWVFVANDSFVFGFTVWVDVTVTLNECCPFFSSLLQFQISPLQNHRYCLINFNIWTLRTNNYLLSLLLLFFKKRNRFTEG